MTRPLVWQLGIDAFRDLSARDVVLTAVLVVATALGTSMSASAFLETINHEAELVQAGTFVWEVEAVDEPALRWRDCVNATTVTGVKASGGYSTSSAPLYNYATSGASVSVLPVTDGALRAWDLVGGSGVGASLSGFPHDDGLWIGRDLADTSGIGLGALVNASSDDVSVPAGQVSRLLPPSLPNALLQASILVTAPPTKGVTGCWMRLERWSAGAVDDIVQSIFGAQIVEVSRYRNPPIGPSANDRLIGDAGRRSWPILLAVVALVSLLVGWTQRAHVAVYRAIGVSFIGQWWIRLVQALLAVPFAIATALIVVGVHFLADGSGPAPWALGHLFRTPILIVLGWVVLVPLVRLVGGWGNIQGGLQDR